MDPLAPRVARKYMAFKYQPKETKEHKVERIAKALREATGLSRTQAEAIADALVRGRDMTALTLQKGWPIEGGIVEGPKGTIELKRLIETE